MADRFRLCAALAVLVVAAVLTAGSARAGAVVLRGVTAWPQNDDIQNRGFMIFMDRVRQKSGDRIQVNWVGGPETLPPFELGEAVRRGLVDLAWLSAAYYLPGLPEAGVFDFSELTPKEERASGAFDYINGVHQRKFNVYVLGRGPGYGYSIYTTRAIRRVADFQNLRMRVSPVYVPFVQALGAQPVVMPGGEIYTAMERGVVQGFTWPEIGIQVLKWDEVVKYKVYPPYWQVDIVHLINLNRWRGLPRDLQEILREASVELEQELPAFFRGAIERENAALRARGIEMVELQGIEGQEYLRRARDSGWEWIRQNVKEEPDALVRLFSRSGGR